MFVRYCDYYQENRNDPSFYTWDTPEWVASVFVEDKVLELWTVGEMRINLPNDEIIRYADDLNHNEIYSDADLENIPGECWINNSWLELRDFDGQWIGDVLSGHIYHDIKEGVEACEELLKNSEFLSEYPCKNPAYVVE